MNYSEPTSKLPLQYLLHCRRDKTVASSSLKIILFLPYRLSRYLVTNLVMNLVTNLVITKLGEEFGDIFVTLFGDSPNWVMILVVVIECVYIQVVVIFCNLIL